MRTWIWVAALTGLAGGGAWAHEGHGAQSETAQEQKIMLAQAEDDEPTAEAPGITGQAPYQFRIKTRAVTIPRDSWQDLRKAHGGFAVDHRAGKGETYFALPNTGLLRVNAAMDDVEVLKSAPELTNGQTMHNTTIWYDGSGEAFLVFPAVDGESILTTDLNGQLVNKLSAPTADQMSVAPVKEYFGGGGKFVPTDVEHFDGLYYISTGYSPLDYVLTAKVTGTKPFATEWNGLAFGGKGDADGQFRTGHGITAYPDGKHLVVADRPKSRLQRFTPEGVFVDQVRLPDGTLPCDVDYVGGYTLVPCLEGADKEKGAPIYLLKDGKIISEINCKEDLGMVRFRHIHNAVLRQVDGRLYIIAQAWNPGDFVVLEQVAP